MSRIKGKNTKPEMLVRRYLYARGFRYRVNVPDLPGKPDIVLQKYRTVIFIHGCFWHNHSCLGGRMPKSRESFWREKFSRNQERDERVRQQLRDMGWYTMVVWECQLKPSVREKTLLEVEYLLNKALLRLYQRGLS